MDHSVNHLHVSLCAAQSAEVALCAALEFSPRDDLAPEWVHLLPLGEIRTGDGRGPYRFADAAKLIAASLQAEERLVIDENHSTDLAAPKGLPAPAMGWVTALESRDTGIWGKVEWTEAGRQLVAGRAYRGLSPVIAHDKAGNVHAVLRASLVNKPNLKGLTTLHSETSTMDLLAKLQAALGLPTDTSEETLVTAITTMHGQQGKHAVALQAQIDPVAEAAGLGKGATADAVLAAVLQLASGNSDAKTIVALQAEVTSLGEQLVALQDKGVRKAAEDFVDGAITAGRVGVKPLRDTYIAMHMANPANVETIINGLPAVGGRLNLATTPASRTADGKRVLSAEQETTIALMQISREAYIAQLEKQEQAEAAL